ncbi:MAG: ATP-binding cassette domain-containing protein [Actinobacteria bacterium]|nr:ATP-binding cassette domain-containing protein [Actinomycetota bacterium]
MVTGDRLISVEGLVKSFGATRALRGVDLEVREGEVLALLGPNGAGKTTLVRVLATLLRPDSGGARVAGYDVVAEAEAVRPLIGLTGQFAAVDELLTGRENLELVGRFYHLDEDERRRRATAVLERFDLLAAGDRLVKTYSGGMRRRLDVGAGLIGGARVLFLDEPTTGLDPRNRSDVWDFVDELVAGGTTVLLTTQYMEEAERLADRIAVIDSGSLIAAGTATELKLQMGGDVLEARVADAVDLERCAATVAAVAGGEPRLDRDLRTVTVPTTGSTPVLLAVGERLQAAGVGLEDLGIRHPSLDDVFLSLTGNGGPPATTRGNGAAGSLPVAAPRTAEQAERAAPPPAPRRDPVGDVVGVTGRNLRRLVRTPRLLAITAIQPALLLVLFRYVLGGAVHIPGGSYVDYVVPAVFLEAVMIGGMATAIGLADDFGTGIFDRLRSLPIVRYAVLAGRTLADLTRSVFALALMVGLGLLVGFGFHGSLPSILAGLALVIFFGYCFSWVYATIGLLTKDPETAQVAGILPFFILVFASSAIVPVETMPSWLQPFAEYQPVSVTIDATRALMQGEPTGTWVLQSLAWAVGILAVFSTIAVQLYRRSSL